MRRELMEWSIHSVDTSGQQYLQIITKKSNEMAFKTKRKRNPTLKTARPARACPALRKKVAATKVKQQQQQQQGAEKGTTPRDQDEPGAGEGPRDEQEGEQAEERRRTAEGGTATPPGRQAGERAAPAFRPLRVPSLRNIGEKSHVKTPPLGKLPAKEGRRGGEAGAGD
ncbi:unnamed protein product [Prorocentrum cordatum]|uniref:Uncharacterized protein n=1 Tax=Prorocentrum cordatum TaxID=2364126 RepID=A0ABN9UNQ2_9DINO|nr:unnamed protein product [Polarella glacialis]